MFRVTCDDGSVVLVAEHDGVEVENYPMSPVPKKGYERTREYPPEYRRFTLLRPQVLSKGSRVRIHSGIRTVTNVEKV